jgi:hypothetical protein
MELACGGNVDEAFTQSQNIVRRFGELVHCWPDMVEAAIWLKSKGIRIAQPA